MLRTIVIGRKKIAKGTEKLTQAQRGPMAKGRLNPGRRAMSTEIVEIENPSRRKRAVILLLFRSSVWVS